MICAIFHPTGKREEDAVPKQALAKNEAKDTNMAQDVSEMKGVEKNSARCAS